MKELDGLAGTHINDACERLVKNAPAFMVFNDVRLEAVPGVTAGDLVARYHAEMDRLRAEHEEKRKAFEATPEGQKKLAEARRAKNDEDRRHAEALANVDRSGVRTKYPWPDGAGEISGFGGGYESACLDMFYAGLAWIDAHPGAELKATSYRNVFGILNAESDDAKAMERVVLDACPGCSGAMHHAVMGRLLHVAKHGWASYVEAVTKPGKP